MRFFSLNTMNRRYGLLLLLVIPLIFGCPSSEVPEPGASVETPTADGSSEAQDLKRIIILINGESPFWSACRYGMQDAEKELGLADAGYQAVMEVNDGSPQGQLDKLRQFASQSDIVAVGISATDANNVAIADELRNLQKKGVKVITVDSDVDREKFRDARTAFVGTDNLAGGKELGTCAKNLNSKGGGYVTFVGRTGAQNAIERVGGFGEGAGDAFEALDNMGDENDKTRARDNVRNAIRNHGEKLTTLVGIWSYNAPAIVDVVKELGKRKEMTIVTFDAEPLAIRDMGDGQIDAMIVQNPYQMGYQGVRLLRALVEEDEETVKAMLPNMGEAEGDIYDTGLKVVVPNSESPLKQEMFSEKTEFLTLEAFKAWLDKYNLEGS